MAINSNSLRAKIYGKYASQAEFSRQIDWDINKINKIIKGKRTPDVDECAKISNILGLSRDEYFDIFLPSLSPNGVKQATPTSA